MFSYIPIQHELSQRLLIMSVSNSECRFCLLQVLVWYGNMRHVHRDISELNLYTVAVVLYVLVLLHTHCTILTDPSCQFECLQVNSSLQHVHTGPQLNMFFSGVLMRVDKTDGTIENVPCLSELANLYIVLTQRK